MYSEHTAVVFGGMKVKSCGTFGGPGKQRTFQKVSSEQLMKTQIRKNESRKQNDNMIKVRSYDFPPLPGRPQKYYQDHKISQVI